MNQINYNPDILTCLASLSNDEVFTPPKIVNEMLDLLPAELWTNKDAKFLDPVSKTGIFLREIAKRLMKGLEKQIPDRQERVNHILKNQLFGIAITELTSYVSRRSLYCSKTANGKYSVCTEFKNKEGNIRFNDINHEWVNGSCKYCGASKEVYDRGDELESHAYEFIHTKNPEEVFKMKFDVIIGNPPYQMSSNKEGIQATPLYHKFVEQAKKLNPRYLSMIIPARWYAGGMGLESFRDQMLKDRRIRVIHDFPKSRDCFPGVDIAGGVCYFLWDRDNKGDCEVIFQVGKEISKKVRALDEFNIFIRDNLGIDIIHKTLALKEESMANRVHPISPFGLPTSARGAMTPFSKSITLISSAGKSYIKKSEVKKNTNIVGKYKVSVGQLNPDRGGVNNAADGKMNVITKINIYKPEEVITATYLLLDYFDTLQEAKNYTTYMSTKFARFLLSLTLSSMHITKSNFIFVPVQRYNKSWTDKELYSKYSLTKEEIDHLEGLIRSMDVEFQ